MPAGSASTHFEWFAACPGRTWKLIVNWYEAAPPLARNPHCDDLWHVPLRYKYPGLAETVPGLLDRFDRFWFPDDDLEFDPRAIDLLFGEFESSGFDLAQPSLTADSATAYPFLKHKGDRTRRPTTFVEVMCPLLTRRALDIVLSTFTESKSGWGLDLLWSKLIGDAGLKMGVLDAVQVRHRRPTGQSRLYQRLKQDGIDHYQEMRKLIRKYKLPTPRAIKDAHAARIR